MFLYFKDGTFDNFEKLITRMVELVYTLGLGSSFLENKGSSPFSGSLN